MKKFLLLLIITALSASVLRGQFLYTENRKNETTPQNVVTSEQPNALEVVSVVAASNSLNFTFENQTELDGCAAAQNVTSNNTQDTAAQNVLRSCGNVSLAEALASQDTLQVTAVQALEARSEIVVVGIPDAYMVKHGADLYKIPLGLFTPVSIEAAANFYQRIRVAQVNEFFSDKPDFESLTQSLLQVWRC